MSKDVKFIKPQKFYELFDELGECVYEKIFDMKDRYIFTDRQKFIDDHFDWTDYKDNDEDSKEDVRDMDIESVCMFIGQILLFGRIIKENQFGEMNLPKGEVPLFMRQIDDDGNENDLYDVSSLSIMKKWSKKKKGKKKLREVSNQI